MNDTRDIDYLFCGERAFRFRQPITIDVYDRDGVCVNEYRPLRIKAYSRNELEALRAFAEEFSSCWFWIARERDSRLDPNAQALKRTLKKLVTKVEPAADVIARLLP